MKALILTVALFLLPAVAHAGVLVSLATPEGPTAPNSGASILQVEAVSGLRGDARLVTLDLEEGDSTIKNLDARPHPWTYSFQVVSIEFPPSIDGDNSGTTFTVKARWSNEDASWSLSGTSNLMAMAVSGNTRHPVEFTIPVCRYLRLEVEGGATPFQAVKGRLLVP